MSKEKTQLEVHKQIDLLVEDDQKRGQDWYKALCEEVDAIRVETTFNAMDTLLSGKLAIGKAIANHTDQAKPTELVRQIALDLRIGERDLWYCYKFYEQYDNIKDLPIFQSKAISWNKVKKVIAEPSKAKEPCLHVHTEMVCLCTDCGAKVSDNE